MADAAAAARVPWIGAQWDLIDLQVDQRGGRLRSSMSENGTLRLRAGDNFRLAVVFFNGTGAAIAPSLSRLRWSLRDAANLEPVSSATIAAPVAQTDQSQPYFLIEPNVTRLGGVARDLMDEAQGELPCVMDVDWTIDSDVYSSQTMPVVVEFGLTLQGASGSTKPPDLAPSEPSPETPRAPETPRPPESTPPQEDLSEDDLRALFDEWLAGVSLPPGPTGSTGPQGPQGPAGVADAEPITVTLCTPTGPQTVVLYRKL